MTTHSHPSLLTLLIPWNVTTGFSVQGAFHERNLFSRTRSQFLLSRRICSGIFLAEREVFLAIARMLWAFKMEEIPGEPIDLKEYDGLSGRSPVPFRIKMIPRDDMVREVLNI